MLAVSITLLTVHVVLAVTAARDMRRRDNLSVVANNKILWLFIIVFIGIIGPLIYFIYGRK